MVKGQVEQELEGRGQASDLRPTSDTAMLKSFMARMKAAPKTSHKMIALGELRRIHGRRWPNGQLYAPTSNRTLITKYRAAISAQFGARSPALETMKYSQARVTAYKRAVAEQRDERLRNQRPLGLYGKGGLIDSAVTVLEFANTVSWDTATAIAGVIALTGRRPYEVACTGRFAEAGEHEVLFSGQAKTRDEHRATAAFQIPVLDRVDLVLETVDQIRQLIDPAMPNREYSQRWGRAVGREATTFFRDVTGRAILPRELREAYAAAAAFLYKPVGMADLVYANQILGHKPLDLDTTTFYFDFYVVDEAPAKKKRGAAAKTAAKKAPAKKGTAKRAGGASSV